MLWPNIIDEMMTRPTCVLAPDFSLAPNGLFWALGLAKTTSVWLAQSHWAIIDDEGFYARDRRLVEHFTHLRDGDSAIRLWSRGLKEWREAREQMGLESRPGLFWPGDGRSDSVVPKDGDPTLIDRLSALATGLDSRTNRVTRDGIASGDALADCARDTLALAAALASPSPIVLTLSPDEERSRMPGLAARLGAADIPCLKLDDGTVRDALSQRLLPALIASGVIVPALHERIRVAALLIVTPRAFLANAAGSETEPGTDPLAWNAPTGDLETRLWDDAAAIWWEPL